MSGNGVLLIGSLERGDTCLRLRQLLALAERLPIDARAILVGRGSASDGPGTTSEDPARWRVVNGSEALASVERAARETNATVIVSSGEHRLARDASARVGTRWLVDLDDPGPLASARTGSPIASLRSFLARRAERRALRDADGALFSNEACRLAYTSAIPALIGRAHLVPQAIDSGLVKQARDTAFRPALFPDLARDTLALAVRDVSGGRSDGLRTLLRALRALLRDGFVTPQRLRVFILAAHAKSPEIVAAITAHEVEPLVEVLSPRDTASTYRVLCATDGTLLAGSRHDPSARVPIAAVEALAMSPCVIGLVARGALAEKIESCGHSLILDPGDPAGLEHALATVVREDRVPAVATTDTTIDAHEISLVAGAFERAIGPQARREPTPAATPEAAPASAISQLLPR